MTKTTAIALAALGFALAATADEAKKDEAWAGYALDTGAKTAEVKTTAQPPPANAPYRNPGLDVEKRIDDLLPRLLPEEKAKLLHAAGGLNFGHIPRIGLEMFRACDAGMGPRAEKRPGITGFPAPIAYAAAFDRALVREIGRVMGEETRAVYPAGYDENGVARILLGPGANIARTPVCARNFEYFGEDPRLAGETAAAWIAGLQSVKVAPCMKHYCFNEQEYSRCLVDVDCDERATREIYTRPWEIAIRRVDPWAFMNSYNKFRGEWTSHSRHLNDMLTREYGSTGALVPDWGGYHGDVQAINGGTTIESACEEDPARDAEEVALVKKGVIEEGRFDEAVRRALRLYFRIGAFDGGTEGDRALQAKCEKAFHSAEHQAVARRAAEEGYVLVKNADGFLPVEKSVTVAVVGPYADVKHNMSDEDTKLVLHGGAAAIKSAAESTPAEGFRAVFGAANVLTGEDAVALAKQADLVVYCGGIDHLYDSEAGGGGHVEPNDRRDIFLRAFGGRVQEDEIRAVAAANPNVVVALSGGAPVSVEEWHESVKAIFVTWYGGEFAGVTLARMVKGEVNPSGCLPYTYGKTLHDWPSMRFGMESYPGDHPFVDGGAKGWAREDPKQKYLDGVWVGYRGFDRFKTGVRYPFGHGLSYTTFALEATAGTGTLSVKVTNTGRRAGRRVVKCWASKPDQPDAEMPARELVDFASVFLRPGESKTVLFTPGYEELKYWSVKANAWRMPQGEVRLSAD